MKIQTRYWIPFVTALMVCFSAQPAWSDGKPGLLLFLSGGPTSNEVAPDTGPEGSDVVVDADVMFSFVNGRFRLLGEYIVSTEENELERFQLGWQLGEESIGWFGRFHTPGSYWNFTYHHGQYLQTSITRPHIEQFEDDAGILPTHISGLMLETAYKAKGAADYQIAFSLGTAPVLDDNELRPFSLQDGDHNPDNKLSASFRLAYLPDQLGENQLGLISGWSDILVEGSQVARQKGIQNIKQFSVGAYIDWRWQDWRVISSMIHVTNRMIRLSQNRKESFVAGYAQAENVLDHEWTLFARLEETTDAAEREYFELFMNSVIERQVLGLRFDFIKNHALTIEFAQARTRSDEFDQAMLQWSAVLP